jgi:hypothetical protein
MTTAHWFMVGQKEDNNGNVVDIQYHMFTTTLPDIDVIENLGPTVRDTYFKEQGFLPDEVQLFKAFRAPLGVEDEDDDDQENEEENEA